jgi:hypothetical protein
MAWCVRDMVAHVVYHHGGDARFFCGAFVTLVLADVRESGLADFLGWNEAASRPKAIQSTRFPYT